MSEKLVLGLTWKRFPVWGREGIKTPSGGHMRVWSLCQFEAGIVGTIMSGRGSSLRSAPNLTHSFIHCSNPAKSTYIRCWANSWLLLKEVMTFELYIFVCIYNSNITQMLYIYFSTHQVIHWSRHVVIMVARKRSIPLIRNASSQDTGDRSKALYWCTLTMPPTLYYSPIRYIRCKWNDGCLLGNNLHCHYETSLTLPLCFVMIHRQGWPLFTCWCGSSFGGTHCWWSGHCYLWHRCMAFVSAQMEG